MAGEFLYLEDEACENVCVVIAALALEYHAEPLEAHSCVNVLCRKRFQRAISLAIVLHEHQVPYFYDLIIVGIYQLVPWLSGDFFIATKVDMNFRARSARSCLAHFPEIIVLVAQKDMIFWHVPQPCLLGF